MYLMFKKAAPLSLSPALTLPNARNGEQPESDGEDLPSGRWEAEAQYPSSMAAEI